MYDFSQVEFAVFLSNVINLFNDTLTVAYNQPVFRFFMAAILFLVAVSLLARLVHQGNKGRL